VNGDPFTALGLPARPGLTDDDIRAAWRRVAAATHPDRADGGDAARFAAAAAAYTELRTRSGRGEAYADLAARPSRQPGSAARVPPPHATPCTTAAPGPGPPPAPRPAPRQDPAQSPDPAQHPDPAPRLDPAPRPDPAQHPDTALWRDTLSPARPGGLRARFAQAATALATRVRRGRPALLALRIMIAAGVSAAAFAIVGAQPAAAGLTTGALTWLLLTARHDLMPPKT
jgi:hypothetical protein